METFIICLSLALLVGAYCVAITLYIKYNKIKIDVSRLQWTIDNPPLLKIGEKIDFTIHEHYGLTVCTGTIISMLVKDYPSGWHYREYKYFNGDATRAFSESQYKFRVSNPKNKRARK